MISRRVSPEALCRLVLYPGLPAPETESGDKVQR